MIDRPRTGERAILVHVGIGRPPSSVHCEEFEELALSAGAEVLASISATRQSANPKFLVGSGKADEISALVAESGADIVLVNHDLSPSQERNLERVCKCRVLDRAGLILDIFAQRARSHEGKLQVELAQLEHLSTRLVRGWTHLERQKGGIGLRGPGETQLESDRRMLGQRVKMLRKRLEKVSRQRSQSRRQRQRSELPVISLVGYTNAGKSTLFNTLSAAGVYAADQLFATLDPTLRKLELPGGEDAILADTVGFVRDLPHELVAAFQSTLDETREAALLLHVIDSSDPDRHERIDQVNQVLKRIGAAKVPQIEVYNKIDLIEGQPRIERSPDGRVRRIWLSAVSGAGVPDLVAAIAAAIANELVNVSLTLGGGDGRLRVRLFALGGVVSERVMDDGSTVLRLRMPRVQFERFCHREKIADESWRYIACDASDGSLESAPRLATV